MSNFNFLMISAMYENGGNTVHRFLDGHPEMFVYPFESQIGTRLVVDSLSSQFPVKYRWPVFPLEGSAYGDYRMIIDEEGKVRARTPRVSKFRHMAFEFSDDERCEIYCGYIEKWGRSRANNVRAFFTATFDAWKDYRITGRQKVYTGYSPIIIVDAEKILEDFPGAHILHVVRNPWSAYADTKKRPVPMSLAGYINCWNLNQYFALLYRKMFPRNVHIVKLEDVLSDSTGALGEICGAIGLESASSLEKPSWNGAPLEEVYPWGTIRSASVEANLATASELDGKETDEIRVRTWQYLEVFGYDKFLD